MLRVYTHIWAGNIPTGVFMIKMLMWDVGIVWRTKCSNNYYSPLWYNPLLMPQITDIKLPLFEFTVSCTRVRTNRPIISIITKMQVYKICSTITTCVAWIILTLSIMDLSYIWEEIHVSDHKMIRRSYSSKLWITMPKIIS